MGKKRKSKSKDPFDDVLDVVKFGAKATIGLGVLGAVSNAVKK